MPRLIVTRDELRAAWSPLLFDDERNAARLAIAEIVAACHDVHGELDGQIGRVLLLDAVSRAGLEELGAVDELIVGALERATSLALEQQLLTLSGGLGGVAWVTARMTDDEDTLGAFDDALVRGVEQLAVPTRYDLLSGLVGLGLYGLERTVVDAGGRIVRRVLADLEAMACERDGATFWHTPAELLPPWLRESFPDGRIDLGIAHGIAGVIGFLARVIAADLEVARSRQLLDRAILFLRESYPTHAGPRFPAFAIPGASPGRLAWCYGDLGIAMSLLAAARAIADTELAAEAVELAITASTRPEAQTGVVDANLCHGAAGVAHLLNRIYQATGDERAAAAARAWFARTLAMRRPGEGIGGYSWQVTFDGVERAASSFGVIEGSGGIALALVAALSEDEPIWDRMLLCDL